VCFSFIW